jgi:predicted AAA+ superfamily ATPase
METRTLWPLSQGELAGRRERFVDRLLSVEPVATSDLRGVADLPLGERITRGGFPPAAGRAAERRDAWLASYVGALLDRDIRDLADIDRLAAVPRLLAILAARTAGLLNVADLGRISGIPATTLDRYLALLEHVFLVRRIPAWHANIGKRQLKSPKLHVVDSGLAAHLLGTDAARVERDGALAGPLLESFVVMEVVKQCSWLPLPPRVHHFRTAGGLEVDVVVEHRDGSIAGVEVKASTSVRPDDFRGLRELAAAHGERFVRGVVLYGGDEVVPFAERLAAWPLSALWAG